MRPKLITINGETHTIREWSEISGVNYRTIKSRLQRGAEGAALLETSLRSKRLVTINGETRPLSEWGEITGINRKTIASRLRAGVEGEALFAPPERWTYTINGETKTRKEWRELYGIKAATLAARRRAGCAGEDLIRPPAPWSHCNFRKTAADCDNCPYDDCKASTKQWEKWHSEIIKEQRLVTIKGEIRTREEWAAIIGISYNHFCLRLRRGLTEDALLAPPRKAARYTINGETHTIAEWAEMSGIGRNTLYARVRRAWKAEDLLLPPGGVNRFAQYNDEFFRLAKLKNVPSYSSLKR